MISTARAIASILMAVGIWICITSTACAHASLTGANPHDGSVVAIAPVRFDLYFSEPVSPMTLRLVEPDGASVTLDGFVLRDTMLQVEAPPGLSHGTYVLSWRVVSEDGHPVGGSIIFSIGALSAAPTAVPDAIDWHVRAAVWIAKVGLYAGLFFGIGGVFAVDWFMGGVAIGRRYLVTMLTIGFIGTAASAAFQGLDAIGAPLSRFGDPLIWTTSMKTSFGRTVIVMIAALLMAASSLALRRAAGVRWLSLLAIAAGSTALALSGHASAAEPQWLTRPAVFAHAFCIAIWAGALVPLGILLGTDDMEKEGALRRFSRLIPLAVGVLVIAGITLAVIQLQRPSALLDSTYGNVLMVKLALLALLFALAAVNRWMLTLSAVAGDARATRQMVRSIAFETVVVLAVFGVAATWRFTPPPRALAVAAAQPISTHIQSEKAMAEVTVTPGRAGPVAIAAFVMKGDFDPLDAKEVTFVLSNPAAGIEPIKRKAIKDADGTWRARGVLVPLAGTWKIRVDILISDFELAKIEGELKFGG